MRKETETDISSDICQDLRRIYKGEKIFVLSLAGSFYQRNGLPDKCVIYNGVHYWIEFKGAKTVIRPEQIICHKEMKSAGANVFLVRLHSLTHWTIDDLYEIKHKKRSDGSKLLLETLVKIVNERSEHVSIPFT